MLILRNWKYKNCIRTSLDKNAWIPPRSKRNVLSLKKQKQKHRNRKTKHKLQIMSMSSLVSHFYLLFFVFFPTSVTSHQLSSIFLKVHFFLFQNGFFVVGAGTRIGSDQFWQNSISKFINYIWVELSFTSVFFLFNSNRIDQIKNELSWWINLFFVFISYFDNNIKLSII